MRALVGIGGEEFGGYLVYGRTRRSKVPVVPPLADLEGIGYRMAMLVGALGLQPQPHACRPVQQLHRACTRMDEAALIDDQPLTAPARVKRVTLLPPSAHAQQRTRAPPARHVRTTCVR